MTDPFPFLSNGRLPDSMDYESLREVGMEVIRELAAKTWTDHNAHDPGITILEAWCYALTELAYRAHLPLEQILGPKPEERFFTAEEALEAAPLTEEDYTSLALKDAIEISKDFRVFLQGVYFEYNVGGQSNIFPDIYLDSQNNISKLTFNKTAANLTLKSLCKVYFKLPVEAASDFLSIKIVGVGHVLKFDTAYFGLHQSQQKKILSLTKADKEKIKEWELAEDKVFWVKKEKGILLWRFYLKVKIGTSVINLNLDSKKFSIAPTNAGEHEMKIEDQISILSWLKEKRNRVTITNLINSVFLPTTIKRKFLNRLNEFRNVGERFVEAETITPKFIKFELVLGIAPRINTHNLKEAVGVQSPFVPH
jgi:hypothetical protein